MKFNEITKWILPGILLLGLIVYLPGLNGPYFFDDYTNLLGNPYVQIKSIDLGSLYQAAFSLSAGPLQRPISMTSFALNYFWAGDFQNAWPYKSVNLAIHLINAFLVYWLTRLIFQHLTSSHFAFRRLDPRFSACIVALVWMIHPIQLSSVLYVVQRMTELAALFSLLGLLCYFIGRIEIKSGNSSRGALLLFLTFTVCWPLGLYSKETAALLPVFMLTLDYVLFADEPPWYRWDKLPRRTRVFLLCALAAGIVVIGIAAMTYALPNYSLRTFTMAERIMTEARVVIFYLGLMFIPSLDAFGLFHDDFPISTSLLSPWTTLPSIALNAFLIALGFTLRRKNPLASLGILWFFAGHLLESTIFSLEIAHEHRNYLPLYGVLLAVTSVIAHPAVRQRYRYFPTAIASAILILGTITTIRASQWSSESKMAYYEATHHPESAASLVRYANVLLSEGQTENSLELMRRVAILAPHEAGYLISIQAVVTSRGGSVNTSDHQEIMRRLSTYPITPVTLNELAEIGDCITTKCRALQPFVETWLQIALKKSTAKDVSFIYFLRGRNLVGQGKFDEAIDAYKHSYELDNNFLHPLLDLVELYVALGYLDHASVILDALRDANARSIYKRDKAIEYLAAKIDKHKMLRQMHAKPDKSS